MAEDIQPEKITPKGRGLVGRLLIGAFMAMVIGSECMLAYFWLPSAEQVAAKVEELAKEEDAEAAEKQGKQEDKEAIEVVEVDLGEFSITNSSLASEATFRVDFHLCGTVAESDQSEFDALFKRNRNRFRDRVTVEIRDCTIDALMDSGLGLIKRQILAKSNTVLGKSLLRSVLFAEYSVIEL